MTLLEQFREIFPTCGMTQAELARKSGHSHAAICNWLNGNRNNPATLSMEDVFQAMGYDVKVVKK